MTCESVQEMLGPYLDGELDASAEFQLRGHLAECLECPQAFERLRLLKQDIQNSNLHYTTPQGLEERIRGSLRSIEKARQPGYRSPRWFLAMAAAAVVALCLGLGIYVLRSQETSRQLLAQEIVSSHIRAMMGTHLVDVPSSDQHTVKPWFNGKLDFSPPVKDLKEAGFVLTGGRIDYVADRPAAALIYERRKHIINLFIWSTPGSSRAILKPATLNGYNLIQWTSNAMTFSAVSDLNMKELQQFAALFRS